MLLQPTTPSESILGYKLKERIGAGGYGEVWAAEAPGGIQKAVKLIFGFHDENRAQRELKSLNRIKEVRHPFLLSLERIDVVDGRLVVVTELAERSLKDVFVACVREGQAGVPRSELLVYLSDAADALDYLSDAHSLQHLDIKPENLLVVGGHVKVADFGLVKDIHDGTQSLMSGLTPTYAPPELFDGRPNRNSDQYSLAIVFQEMLTGTRPFNGRTAAQLASQHLNGSPDLREMPPADQKVLKRALAKSPDVRYSSCREFVEELKRTKRTKTSRPAPTPVPITRNASVTNNGTLAIESNDLAALATKLVEQKLPPVEVDDNAGTFKPTVFIGIGQTATSVLCHLRRRFRERFGEADKTPSLKLLCVDTDTRNLDNAARDDDPMSLDYEEILPVPLRSSAEYRDRKDLDLSWLSRRWIYNVPRSQQTQCLRPLGRLAFVDHHRAVFEKLDKLVDAVTAESAPEKTAATVKMKPDAQTPQVFVVASISGGVGSGMVNDMAYAARTILSEHGYSEAAIHGVLLYSSGRSSSRRDVTVANAYACLNELNHFSSDEGFPGDPSCDLPAYDDVPTFDHTYLVDLGHDPLPDEYEATADELAEFLYLHSTTSCGDYFEACRQSDHVADGKLHVRTVGLSRSGWTGGDAVSLPANVVGHGLLAGWLNPATDDQTFDPSRLVADAFERLELSANTLGNLCGNELEHRLERSLADSLDDKLNELIQNADQIVQQEGPIVIKDKVESVVAQVLGAGATCLEGRFEVRVNAVMDKLVDEITQSISDELTKLILGCLDEEGSRLWQTEQVHRITFERLQQLRARMNERQRTIRSDVAEQLTTVASLPHDENENPEGITNEDRCAAIRKYGELKLALFSNGFAARFIGLVEQNIEQFGHGLREIHQAIAKLSTEFEHRFSKEERAVSIGGLQTSDIISDAILRRITTDIRRIVSGLDVRLQSTFFNPYGGFQNIGKHRLDDWTKALRHAVYMEARHVVSEEVLATDLDQILNSQSDPVRLEEWLRESASLAVPHLLNMCGGGSRLVVAVPHGMSTDGLSEFLSRQTEDKAKFVNSTLGDVVFCYEVGGITVGQVAAMLLHSCPDAGDLVERIYTRTDVNWQPIIKL